MWVTWVRFLGLEDPLKKGKATHSQCPDLENSMDSIRAFQPCPLEIHCGASKFSTQMPAAQDFRGLTIHILTQMETQLEVKGKNDKELYELEL